MTQNGKISRSTLVLGGARSGKSEFAERLVLASGLTPVYIATSEVYDSEMAQRVETHKLRRGTAWKVIEVPIDLVGALNEIQAGQIVLIDCLTLWLSNIMLADHDVETEQINLLRAINDCQGQVVSVSNEVGMGIVPENRLGRRFRDAQGILNQQVAQISDLAIFVAAGLPLVLKGTLPKGLI
ncbi:MAG: bifunctional adenosylcobinamide kinase/adenosylcobinamide-phosphate guanylyltransferase [Rhodobacteraceae bacterium]|nr:bifunctional adenosylcobinamide kinase/adenosylcobinamide-phosphate guanylyltransferase [Paracoccaceae bacterium]